MDFLMIPLEKDDPDLPLAEALVREPSAVAFLSLSENYFSYVTESKNAVWFKLKSGKSLLGGLHCEVIGDALSVCICAAEGFRRRGIAAAALKQLIAEAPEGIRTIEASVDADNIPSLRLFEKLGFRRCGWSEGLLTYRLSL